MKAVVKPADIDWRKVGLRMGMCFGAPYIETIYGVLGKISSTAQVVRHEGDSDFDFLCDLRQRGIIFRNDIWKYLNNINLGRHLSEQENQTLRKWAGSYIESVKYLRGLISQYGDEYYENYEWVNLGVSMSFEKSRDLSSRGIKRLTDPTDFFRCSIEPMAALLDDRRFRKSCVPDGQSISGAVECVQFNNYREVGFMEGLLNGLKPEPTRGSDDWFKYHGVKYLRGNSDSAVSIAKYYWDAEEYSKAAEWIMRAIQKSPDRTGEFEDVLAQLAFSARDYKDSILYSKQAGAHGYVNSYVRLALIYAEGLGTEKSYSDSLACIEKVANNGSRDAAYRAGNYYFYGVGCARNFSRAAKYYEEAANRGCERAAFCLGNMYLNGIGIGVSVDKAVDLLQKSANKNHQGAQYLLAKVKIDCGESPDYLLRQASRGGNPEALNLLFKRLKTTKGDKLLGFAVASAMGSPNALTNLAEMAEENFWGLFGFVSFSDCINLAAEWGDSEAVYKQADRMYGVKKMEMLKLAARGGSARAINSIGEMYLNGKGVASDTEKALRLFSAAAKRGSSAAVYNIGNMYKNGQGVPQSRQKAAAYFSKAAEMGSMDARLEKWGMVLDDCVDELDRIFSNAGKKIDQL